MSMPLQRPMYLLQQVWLVCSGWNFSLPSGLNFEPESLYTVLGTCGASLLFVLYSPLGLGLLTRVANASLFTWALDIGTPVVSGQFILSC